VAPPGGWPRRPLVAGSPKIRDDVIGREGKRERTLEALVLLEGG
jgi:hypothetical protein